jgi:hypothetical protein
VAPGSGRGSAHGWRSGSVRREAEQRSRAGARGRRRREGSEGPFWNLQNLRDLTVNKNSPLIQSSNEKMVKMKVVELFKTYNFALGLKFRNLKYKVLFHHFAFNST